MRINAYILAAESTWIEASVLSYYYIVDTLVVSYDKNGRGWTGAKIDVEECLDRLRVIDRDKKMLFRPGEYARCDYEPMENETYQRQCAIDDASKGVDWVLQIDTDEVLPNPNRLVDILKYAELRNIPAVEWPMRVLFRRLSDGRFLEVCAEDGSDRFEYPGPIAVRPGVKLVYARRTDSRFLVPIVMGDKSSPEIRWPKKINEYREELLNSEDVIVHNSWARSPADLRCKIAAWGHNQGLRSWLYYYFFWLPAPYSWKYLHDFHPFIRGLWPALKPC
ncbi:MAG: hypothetical protein ACRENZ_11150, partial [Thermodesulfobacteriota bacterium]